MPKPLMIMIIIISILLIVNVSYKIYRCFKSSYPEDYLDKKFKNNDEDFVNRFETDPWELR